MRICVLRLPIILALSLLQYPSALAASLESNFVTLPPASSAPAQSLGKGGGKALQKQALSHQLQQQQQPTTQPSLSLPPSSRTRRTAAPSPSQQQQAQSPRSISFNAPVSASSLPMITVASSPTIVTSPPTTGPPTKTKKSAKEKVDKKARQMAQRIVGGEGLKYFYTGPIRKYNLIFPPGALDTLRARPFTEEWAPCSIEVDFGTSAVQRYDGCGCRYKGSVGSLRMCIDRVTGQPNGACRKLSWKVDATRFLEPGPNGEKPTQRIKGVKELSFGGLPVDLSLLTERLAAGLLKSAGIIGFRANYGLLNINGKPDGVYSLLELPGDLFTHDRWRWDAEAGDGALYKEALLGREVVNESYFKEHRVSGTNEDDWMVEVNNALLNATTDSAKQLVVDTYFDVKSFIDVTAFNTVIGNTDDWRQRHNFLWYVLATYPPDIVRKQGDTEKKPKKVKKLVLVPSDYDRINDGNTQRAGLGGAPKHWYDPISPDLCTQVDQTPEQRAARQPKTEYDYWVSLFSQYPPNVGKPINCDQFAKVFSVLARQVNQRIVELATGPLSAASVDALMQSYSAQIAHLPGLDPDPPNVPEWEDGKRSLRDHLNTVRAAALAEARSELASANTRIPALPSVSQISRVSTSGSTNSNSASPAITSRSASIPAAAVLNDASSNAQPTQSSAPWGPLAPPAQQQSSQQTQQRGSSQSAPNFAGFQPTQTQGSGSTSLASAPLNQPRSAPLPSFASNSDSAFAPPPPASAFSFSGSASSNGGALGLSFQPKPPASSSSNTAIASRSLSLPSSTSTSRSSTGSSAATNFASSPSFPSFPPFQGSTGSFPPPPPPPPPPVTNWAPAGSSFGFQPRSG